MIVRIPMTLTIEVPGLLPNRRRSVEDVERIGALVDQAVDDLINTGHHVRLSGLVKEEAS